jgi:hypothetical protein
MRCACAGIATAIASASTAIDAPMVSFVITSLPLWPMSRLGLNNVAET